MTTNNKDFKVKNGIVVTGGGAFGGAVSVGTPTDPSHAITLGYLDGLSLTGAMTVSETPPEYPSSGDMWFDSASGGTFIYYDSYWIQVMSSTGPQGPQGEQGEPGEGISGVTASAAELNILDGATLTTTELNYVDGVTSSIQSQLNSKQDVVGGVSSTEIGYLANVTSDIQTQFGTKADLLSPTITMATLASASTTIDPLTISTANEHGGSGYAGLMKLENSGAGVTTPKKFVRMNNAGALEIVNDGYTSTILNLADNGNLSISGTYNGAQIGDTGWITVSSFTNSFSGTNVAYRRINSVVYLRGRVTGGTANASAFNLPSGFRPSTTDFVVATQQYGTSSITYTTVQQDGNVVPNASSTWLSGVVVPIG